MAPRSTMVTLPVEQVISESRTTVEYFFSGWAVVRYEQAPISAPTVNHVPGLWQVVSETENKEAVWSGDASQQLFIFQLFCTRNMVRMYDT